MKKTFILLSILLTLFTTACSQETPQEKPQKEQKPPIEKEEKEQKTPPETVYKPGDQFTTYVETEGVGNIAVQVTLPERPRYKEGAPLILQVQTFFTEPRGFDKDLLPLTKEGFINVSYLWPGKSMPDGSSSEGEFDFGGEDSIRALADILAFMSGTKENSEGYLLDEIVDIEPLYEHSGIYAFSHPGIAMVNAMSLYADQLDNISYIVARENPTDDIFSSVEIGYWENGERHENPLYSYEDNYDPQQITIDYSSAKYDEQLDRAYFDLNGNNTPDTGDHILGTRIPSMYEKRYYSIEMTKALAENGLEEQGWPEDLATVKEAEAMWPFRTCVDNYPLLEEHEDLHVMLVYSSTQHVQAAQDAPSVHQALDGYKNAGLWFRVNPDEAYIRKYEVGQKAANYTEHSANTEPDDWANAREWGYEPFQAAAEVAMTASIIEMADRSYTDNWSDDLDSVISY